MAGESFESTQDEQSNYQTFTPGQCHPYCAPDGVSNFVNHENPKTMNGMYSTIIPPSESSVTELPHHSKSLNVGRDIGPIFKKDRAEVVNVETALLPSAQHRYNKHEPTILILLCNVVIVAVNCLIRYLTFERQLAASFIACFRGFVQFLMVSSIILAVGPRNVFRPQTRKEVILLSIRGLLSGIGINLRYAAFSRLPVGIATSLFCTNPVFSGILGWIFLGHTLGPVDMLSIFLSTTGAMMIGLADPDPGQKSSVQDVHVEGVLLALLTAVVSSTVFVVLKSMGTSVHFLLSTDISGFCFMLGGFVALAIEGGGAAQGFGNIHDTLSSADGSLLIWLIAAAVLAASTGLCINRGSQLLAPGRMSVLRTSEIPMNFILAFLVLGEFPSSMIILLGCFLIVMSTVLTALKGTS